MKIPGDFIHKINSLLSGEKNDHPDSLEPEYFYPDKIGELDNVDPSLKSDHLWCSPYSLTIFDCKVQNATTKIKVKYRRIRKNRIIYLIWMFTSAMITQRF